MFRKFLPVVASLSKATRYPLSTGLDTDPSAKLNSAISNTIFSWFPSGVRNSKSISPLLEMRPLLAAT